MSQRGVNGIKRFDPLIQIGLKGSGRGAVWVLGVEKRKRDVITEVREENELPFKPTPQCNLI